MSKVTFYNNTFSTQFVDVSLTAILTQIASGKYKSIVEKYRETKDPEIKKTKVPAFTASGTFPNKRKAKDLAEHSGLIAMDFDDVDISVREELYADDYTYAGFLSISGEGICLLVKIDGKKHIEAFRALEKYYFKTYGLQVDQSCKDVSRLRYVSFDPELHLNTDSKIWNQYLPKQKGRKPNIKPVASTDDDIEFVVKQIEANRIDLTADYDTWIDLGIAIYTQFGNSATGEEYFCRISQFYNGFDHDKTVKKYRSFKGLNNNVPNNKKISIATLFHHAKNAGCEIKTQETKKIETVAKWAKRGRRTADQAIDQLEKMDSIPAEKSKQIVNAIFSGEIKPDEDDEDIVFQLEQFMTRERRIIYNEVTLKYQENNKPLNDRDFNSIYLDAKKAIPKATKDLVISVIDSDRTKTVNPIKEFFYQNKYSGHSAISELASCISTPTGFQSDNFFPEYAEFFIRKWMIGAVAMWDKYHSPLMLVLAGAKQNTGKSHFFRYLLPDKLQPYYAEAELTGDKDENLMMCSKALMNNDEMSNKSKRDIAVMKKLCSTQWFNVRKPYGKLSEDFRRIAALCGTSNDLALLSDPTGNRRIIPIEVDGIDHSKYNALDKKDAWCEAWNRYKAGEPFHLTNEDISLLNHNSNTFEESSLEAELVLKYFIPNGGVEFTNSEIKSYIEVRTNQRLSAKKLGMELKRLGFDKKRVKKEGNSIQVYPVTVISHVINDIKQ